MHIDGIHEYPLRRAPNTCTEPPLLAELVIGRRLVYWAADRWQDQRACAFNALVFQYPIARRDRVTFQLRPGWN